MKKVLIIFGTRPEAIKMAPLVKQFKAFPQTFDTKVCVSAQHREMLDQVLNFFKIKADYDLNLMKPDQNLYNLTSEIISSLKTVLEHFKPNYVFVHGDTTTSMAAALSSFYFGAKICHVEAGLRTYDKHSPFPEELNRQITGRLADIHFAPTQQAKINLLNENVEKNSIIVTGNTIIDALISSVKKVNENPTDIALKLSKKIKNRDVILVTGHRRENHGFGFESICKALKKIASFDKKKLIIYPVHLNPKVKEPVNRILSDVKNIMLIKPLAYEDFIWLMNQSKIIITDSGGIQEEAPSLGKPVLVMRDTTERPEAVKSGTVVMVGTNEDLIFSETIDLLSNTDRYEKMSRLYNPYGDGNASKRIVEFLSKID